MQLELVLSLVPDSIQAQDAILLKYILYEICFLSLASIVQLVTCIIELGRDPYGCQGEDVS